MQRPPPADLSLWCLRLELLHMFRPVHVAGSTPLYRPEPCPFRAGHPLIVVALLSACHPAWSQGAKGGSDHATATNMIPLGVPAMAPPPSRILVLTVGA